MIAWVAFGFALTSLALWFAAVVAAVFAWGKVRPFVQSFAPMLSAMMPKAAGTGDVGNVITSSPAAVATPDRCEYEDHEWSSATGPSYAPQHHCVRCGYIEPLPGR